MIKKLRFKFIGVTMLCIGLLFAAILLSLNLSMTLSSQRHGFEMLESIAGMQRSAEERPAPARADAALNPSASIPDAASAPAAPSEPDAPESSPSSAGSDPAEDMPPAPARHPNSYIDAFRVFSITYDKSGEPLSVNYNKESGLSETEILLLGEKVLQSGTDSPKERGVQSRYLYLIQEQDAFRQIYFLDYSVEHSMTYRLFYLCLFVGMIGIVILFAAVFFLSGWMVRPVQRAFTQQKQFIADASHELKTPLTIITANAEVLTATLGQDKWLSHILEQTRRMNALIRDLLDLAKMDTLEDSKKASAFAEFDLSRAVSSAALSFESLAFESHKTYQMQIAEHLSYCGNEQALRQLVTILLDNAFKYSDERGTITISLSPKGKGVLTVHNTGKGITAEDQKHIFERFYRSDGSRSRDTGGYGLGLSIAASIAHTHRAKISVQSDGKSYAQITVIL